MYLIPGCFGRGVRLGSESSSGGSGGVWKSGTWKFGNLGTWKSLNLEIWGPGNPDIWDPTKIKTNRMKLSESKSVLSKMSARSGLVGKNPPGPIWGHLSPFFHEPKQIQKMFEICLFFLVGQWALFTRFGPLLLSTRGGEIGTNLSTFCLFSLVGQ